MVTDHALIVDATCGIAVNVNSQRIFYFVFAFYNRNVITEAVPVLEILTDKPNEESLKFLLIHYLDTLGKRSGSNNFRVPLLAVCDISWPIIRSLIYAFNDKQTLEEYISSCFNILTGVASKKDLPELNMTILHLCLSHVMKCFSFHSKKHFRKHEKRFLMFCCSILVNCDSIGDFKNALLNLFTILISKNETSFTENAITWLEHEADKLGDVKLTFSSFDSDEEQEMGNCDNDDDKVFKSCKGSKFYDLAKDIEKSIKQNMETEDTSAKKKCLLFVTLLRIHYKPYDRISTIMD